MILALLAGCDSEPKTPSSAPRAARSSRSSSPGTEAREPAAGALAEATPVELRAELRDDDPARRLAAIAALRRRWPGAAAEGREEVLAAFREALLDEDAEVRRKALLAHGVTGVDAPATTDAILARLDDPVGAVRAAAAQMLGRAETATAARVVTPALIAGFRDRWRHDVGAWSLAAIARRIGDEPTRSPNRTVVSAMVAELESALEHDNAFIRQGAAMTLGRLGAAAVAARPALTRSARDRHEPTRFQSVLALGKLPNPGLRDLRAVLAASGDASGRVRAMACHSLARPASVAVVASSCPAEGLAALETCAEDRRDDVRSAAMRALGALSLRLPRAQRQAAVRRLLDAIAGASGPGRVAGDGLLQLARQLPEAQRDELYRALEQRLAKSSEARAPARAQRELRRALKRLRSLSPPSPVSKSATPAHGSE